MRIDCNSASSKAPSRLVLVLVVLLALIAAHLSSELSAVPKAFRVVETKVEVHQDKSTPSCVDDTQRSAFFNPFADMEFVVQKNYSVPSSFDCVSTGTANQGFQTDEESMQLRRPNFVGRSCHFRNLLYRVKDQTFHYYASKAESEARATCEDGSSCFPPMAVSLGHSFAKAGLERLPRMGIEPWQPEVHTKLPSGVKALVNKPQGLAFLLYQPYHSFNFGHFLLDDLLSLFTMMDLFHQQDKIRQPLPFFVERWENAMRHHHGGDPQWRCSPNNHVKWNNCIKMYKRLYAPFMNVLPHCTGDILRTGNWLQGRSAVGNWRDVVVDPQCNSSSSSSTNATSPTTTTTTTVVQNEAPLGVDYIVLDSVFAGTGMANFFACEGECALGRGPQYWRFRKFLIKNILGECSSTNNDDAAPIGYVTFSLPIGSSRPDQVHNFTSEIALAKSRYGNEAVKVVDLASMSIQEQVVLIQNTAVLVTNHGGGGLISLFLPRGAAALVFWHGKYRMEHNFYESVGYFRPVWIGVDERSNVHHTMALLDYEVETAKKHWPNIIAGRR